MSFNVQLIRSACKLILLLASITLYSYSIQGQEGYPYKFDDPACGETMLFMETIVKENNNNNERIFVISWIGKNEKYSLNNLRLKEASYIFKDSLGFDAKRLITAIGGRSDSKKGRLEFYVGSKFVLEITTRIGQNVCWTTPDIDPKELKRLRKS